MNTAIERLCEAADAVRAASATQAQALAGRAIAVTEAREAGLSLRAIATAMGLPVASVQADLRRSRGR